MISAGHNSHTRHTIYCKSPISSPAVMAPNVFNSTENGKEEEVKLQSTLPKIELKGFIYFELRVDERKSL